MRNIFNNLGSLARSQEVSCHEPAAERDRYCPIIVTNPIKRMLKSIWLADFIPKD
jgi:hypothetical protein